MKKYVAYADVDDTLLVWNNSHPHGYPAPKAAEFLKWADTHFEIRWLTMWAMSGKLDESLAAELSYRFNNALPASFFSSIENKLGFYRNKTDAIDFDDPRPFVWIEDGILDREAYALLDRKLSHTYYPTHVSKDVTAIQKTWAKLAKDFNLPDAPKEPYDTKVAYPPVILTNSEIIERYRTLPQTRLDVEQPSHGWDTITKELV